jgi:DNA repair photolyase
MPLINDSEPSIDAVAQAAARAGASAIGANVVYLKDSAKNVFLPFLREHFPQLRRRYEALFARDAYIRGDYPETIRERVRRIRRRYGLDRAELQHQPELWPQDPQLTLFS